MSDTSNENDSYFADPHTLDEGSRSSIPPMPADERGYIIRQSVLEEATMPEYVIPVGSAAGTWGMMKRLGRFRPEGWLSLWKGTSYISLYRHRSNNQTIHRSFDVLGDRDCLCWIAASSTHFA